MSASTWLDLRAPAAGERLCVTGLPGCAEALALARLAVRRRVLVLAHDPGAAARLTEQLHGLLPTAQVHHLVGWEVLPYDVTSPPRASVSERVAGLAALASGQTGVYISAATDALLPCMPRERLVGRALRLCVGDRVRPAQLVADLVAAGSVSVDRVRAPGEFAAYGGQFDLYPGGAHRPYRLVFDDDVVAQVRTFDVHTQLSTGRVDKVEVLPAREYPLDDASIERFRGNWRQRICAGMSQELYDSISAGREAEGAEYFLPLFYAQRANLCDYLSNRDLVWLQSGIDAVLTNFAELAQERFRQANLAGIAALSPAEVFIDAIQLRERLRTHPLVELVADAQDADHDCGARALPPLQAGENGGNRYGRLREWLVHSSDRVVFPYMGTARRARIVRAVSAAADTAQETDTLLGRRHGCWLYAAPLSGGFYQPAARLAVITEAELHGFVPAPRSLRRASGASRAELDSFSPGMLVVHAEHGVARYLGLRTLEHDAVQSEFLTLEFAKGVQVHVAVVNCHLVSLHCQSEPGEEVKLHSIGSKRWQKQHAKAERVARDTAAQLLDLYARRAASQGRPLARYDAPAYERFCAAFAYAETADQARVSVEVVADLASDRPMDRLVCGDVGFGKTEIAMRAAWIAWASGKQVAVVAPTTLLATQLTNGFIERFAGTDAVVVELSSARGTAERTDALAAMAAGVADIAVGTHALLGKQVRLPRLGLVIIDEEHRFGVQQKERLRSMRTNVDVLAMSATPIPRTFAMALEGLRDMSLLVTPPDDRLTVRTLVGRDADATVREALMRELSRGGQCFVVQHRIASIRQTVERVRALAPSASVDVAHGQMPARQLAAVMRRFYGGEIDVLVSTNIIESGLDVANANTLVVPRADMFGLAQLHQLRGRVGRAARQAYAYLLTPLEPKQHRTAVARLTTLAASAQLGGGHFIATRDLEIRGAGEILGEAQSGVIASLGIETFRKMLAQALHGTAGAPPVCQVDFGAAARLPINYCANTVERMRMYRRLASAASDTEVGELRDEMVDRFGPLAEQAKLLIGCHRLRLRAGMLGFVRVEATARSLTFTCADPVSVAERVAVLSAARDWRLGVDGVLRISHAGDAQTQLGHASEVCAHLEQVAVAVAI